MDAAALRRQCAGPPEFVLELLSQGSWRNDVGRKLDLYERMGVREYLLFDPTGERFAGEDLFGYALAGRGRGRRPLGSTTLANGKVGVACEVLGLCAYAHTIDEMPEPGERPALALRWHDPATGEDIPDFDESRAHAAAAEARADREGTRADGAEARAESAETRAESAEARAASAEAQATAERLRRKELERRIQDLLARRSHD